MSLLPGGKKVVFPIYDIKTVAKKHPDWFKKDLKMLLQFLKEEKIRPQIAHKFPLEKAAEAQTLLESGAIRGKIILTTGHS